jgi:hypothetical protein
MKHRSFGAQSEPRPQLRPPNPEYEEPEWLLPLYPECDEPEYDEPEYDEEGGRSGATHVPLSLTKNAVGSVLAPSM